MSNRREPRYGRAIVIGAVAGLLASLAMELAQTGMKSLEDKGGEEGGEPATVKAADTISKAVSHAPVAPADREGAGVAVHYATGILLGAHYGAMAERASAVTAGFGGLYGLLVSAILDEGVVPALDLSPPPAEVPLSSHLQGLAAHLVYGATLEAGRLTLDTLLP